LIFVILIGFALGEPPEYWQRSIMSERISTDDPYEVDLTEIVQREVLFGSLIVKNKSSEERTAHGSVMVIEGHESADGTFWPAVELQVQKEKGGEWIKIGSSGNEVPLSEAKVYTGTTLWGLRINLDRFKAHLGQFKLGRIVLKSGSRAEFSLDDLKPPNLKIGK
jgi:hypothetical protein